MKAHCRKEQKDEYHKNSDISKIRESENERLYQLPQANNHMSHFKRSQTPESPYFVVDIVLT